MKIFLMLGVLAFVFSAHPVSAATGDVEGYAWGGGVTPNPAGYDGIGWISMNSRDCDIDGDNIVSASEHALNLACPAGATFAYAVNIPSSGNLSGYAWSELYGWISFNGSTAPSGSDVAGCPGGGNCDARRSGDNILGWARIISICDTGNAGNGHVRDGHCDVGDDGWNAGGWSGWVSLSGSGYGLEVSKIGKRAPAGYPDNTCSTNPSLCTFAYSDELGWIDFSMAGFGNTLKICEGSFQRTLATNIPLSSGGATTLTARYGTGDCSTDPLVSVTWGTELNPDDAIDLSFPAGNNPVNTVGVTAHVTTPSRSENVVATCGAASCGAVVVEKALARVTCPTLCSSLSAQTNAYCPSATRDLNNACGGTISCPGTKDCSYNFKEVNP